MPNRTKLTPEKKEAFCNLLRVNCNVTEAARECAISRGYAYELRSKDEEFAADWDNAIEEGIDALEAIARERAATTSDVLLIFLLKAHRPEKYRENVKVSLEKVDDEIRRLVGDLAGTGEAPATG